jgi:DNA primase
MIDFSLPQKIHNFVEQQFNNYSETATEYAVYCPFHHNTDTPALYINKNSGLWICFNPSCGKKGNIHKLAEHFGIRISTKFIKKDISADELIESLTLSDRDDLDVDWDEALDRISIDYDDSDKILKLDYLINRGFDLDVLEHFEVGFSDKQNRIVVPCRDDTFKLVGFIGRAVRAEQNPRYRYSDSFPKASVLFNLNNAKFYSEVFVTEGSLDAIRVHQAGFPNVVATLGSNVNRKQIDLLNKYFDDIIIMSDADDAGSAMRKLIVDGCQSKNIYVVSYPEGIKDPGEMSAEQIKSSIDNRMGYLDWLFVSSSV